MKLRDRAGDANTISTKRHPLHKTASYVMLQRMLQVLIDLFPPPVFGGGEETVFASQTRRGLTLRESGHALTNSGLGGDHLRLEFGGSSSCVCSISVLSITLCCLGLCCVPGPVNIMCQP